MTGDHKPQLVLQTPFNEGRARFSPDGRWIAYQSDESGRYEVYVASFQGSAGKWQISTDGGSDPDWSPDGRELFYLARNQKLMSVPITPGETLSPGTPQALFDVLTEGGTRRNVYEVAPDGRRFMFLLPAGDSGTPITTVVNWRPADRR
jgi:Tol biopolymer transport system component